jgi:hypothetical protein
MPLSNFPLDLKSTMGPFSGGLPKKLEVGEEFSLKYWYGKNWMDERPTGIVSEIVSAGYIGAAEPRSGEALRKRQD